MIPAPPDLTGQTSRAVSDRWPNGKPVARIKRGAVLLFMALGVVVVIALSTMVWQQLFNLRTASKDNAQWLISQLEIEALKFQATIQDQIGRDDPDLAEVSRRFDVFYSRVGLVTDGYMNSVLRNPGDLDCIARLNTFAQDAAVLIDGPRQDLIAALPGLHLAMDGVYQETRNLALSVVRTLAELEQERRDSIRQMLTGIAIVVSILFAVLVASLSVSVWLYRLSDQRSAALDQAVIRLKATIGATVDAVFLLDQDLTILEYSGAAERMFGYRMVDVIGEDIAGLAVPDRFRPAFRKRLRQVALAGQDAGSRAAQQQLWGRRKSGTEFPIDISAEIATVNNNRLLVVFIRDMSDVYYSRQKLIAARDTARQAEEEKSRFIAVMSHEMRTPLNGIIGAIEILRGTRLTQKQTKFLDILQMSGRRLLMQVNRVLDISRIESGKIDISPRWFDPTDFATQLVESTRHLSESRGNTLAFEGTGLPPQICADDDILRHVVSNILSNAIKFTENGHVHLDFSVTQTGADQGRIRIAVCDTGIGISAANREKVFEDFVSFDRNSGRYQEGAGLGLGIARRLAEALGGSIWLDADQVAGSRFVIEIPVLLDHATTAPTAPEKPAMSANPTPAGTAALRVLLADDDAINRMILGEYLKSLGHQVSFAMNGQDCLQQVQKGRFDLVLMDFSMPVMDGIEAARQIARLNLPQHLPVIGITADINPVQHEKAQAAGMDFCLTKPVTQDELTKALARIKPAGKPGADTPPARSDNPVDAPDPLDPQIVDSLIEVIGGVGFDGLSQRFLAEFKAAIITMQASDGSDLAALAHKQAGSAGAIGAAEIRQAMLSLEALAENGDKADISRRLAGLAALHTRAEAAFAEYPQARDRNVA